MHLYQDQSGGRLSAMFELLAQFLTETPIQLLVMLVTIIFLALGIYGTINLRKEFRPEWLVDPDAEGMKDE